jgi:hypothetical protein
MSRVLPYADRAPQRPPGARSAQRRRRSLPAQLRSAVRRVAITAAGRREVLGATSFRIVPRLQKPAFGVSAHSRLVHSTSRPEVGRDFCFDSLCRLLVARRRGSSRQTSELGHDCRFRREREPLRTTRELVGVPWLVEGRRLLVGGGWMGRGFRGVLWSSRLGWSCRGRGRQGARSRSRWQ